MTLACPSDGVLAGWGMENGADYVPLELKRSVDFAEAVRFRELRRLMASADLVHLHSSKAGAVGRLALASLGSRRPPSIFTPHGWSWLIGGMGTSLYRLIEWILAPVTDAVVAVSEWDCAEGRSVLGARGALTTIPNGVDTVRFMRRGMTAREGGCRVVLVVGRLSRAKGQDLALRAAALLAHLPVEFRFVGAGEEEWRLRALAEEMKLTNVVFLGEQDPAVHYRTADLVLIPSRWDACSLVLLEALSSGTAVLASAGVGAAHSLHEYVHLLPDLSAPTVARAVEALLTDDGLRTRGLRAGTDVVRAEWSESVRMQETLDLYERVLGGSV